MKNIGSAVPQLYAKVMSMVLQVTDPVATSVVTVAKMGPAQGAQINPNAVPIMHPDINPVPVWPALSMRLPKRASGAVSLANADSNCGNNKVRPKNIMSPSETVRKMSGEMPVDCTNALSVKVKKVKLIIRPRMMP